MPPDLPQRSLSFRRSGRKSSLCNASYWHVLPLNMYLIQFVNWKKYFLFTCIRHVFLNLRVIVPNSPSQLLCFLEASKRRLRRGVPNLNVAKKVFKTMRLNRSFTWLLQKMLLSKQELLIIHLLGDNRAIYTRKNKTRLT